MLLDASGWASAATLAVLGLVQSAAAQSPLDPAAAASNASLLWGTYRPQLYHGIRPRLPRSLMTGMMWFGLNDYRGYNEIRHTCEDSDGLTSYTYTQHDGRSFAAQSLVDGKNNVALNVTWLKGSPASENSWAVRVEGDAMNPGELSRTSLIYHFGLEGLGGLELASDPHENGIEGDIALIGSTPALGEFRIRIVEHPDMVTDPNGAYKEDFVHKVGKTTFLGVALPEGAVWRIKDVITQSLTQGASTIMGAYDREAPPDPAYLFHLQNRVQQGSNVFALQKTAVGSGVSGGRKWGFDVVFEPKVAANDAGWTYETLGQEIARRSAAYAARFASTFHLPAEYSTPAYTRFAQAITSNLVGGIGYFYGSSLVDRSFRHSHDDDGDEDEEANVPQGAQEAPPTELLTATPSRSFFPRGFYWDEGFHLAVIAEWDNDLSLEILKSWISLIDENGWVGREQILGEESRSKVPQEFQVQYPSYANPPTLPVALTQFIGRLQAQQGENLDAQLGLGQEVFQAKPALDRDHTLSTAYLRDPALAHSYLTSVYPALRRHYEWFRRTQRGQLREWGRRATSRVEAYRWRGRTEDHVLTSGLDDYPRARPPHMGELHLDLISWMGYFARTMAGVAEYLGEEEDVEEYRRHEKGILANIDDLHWSEEEQMYCDLSVSDEDESIHVCHRGYISLFPFLLGLIPPSSTHLGPILSLMSDPAHLWSPYGLRSLSASHPLFGQGEDYWRGPIWIQVNWMALGALDKYRREEGPQRERAGEIYAELRKNVIENVFKEWERTGYVWEQYDAKNGEGRRSHPFTGWTSLVTLIMTEKY